MTTTIDPVWGLKLNDSELKELQNRDLNQPQPSFKELEEIEPINADDMACFAEIKQVLEKYNKLDRFGVTLLHKHFEMKESEILLESTDSDNRSMKLEPVILDTNNISAIDTQWYLGKSMPLSLVKCRTSMHL